MAGGGVLVVGEEQEIGPTLTSNMGYLIQVSIGSLFLSDVHLLNVLVSFFSFVLNLRQFCGLSFGIRELVLEISFYCLVLAFEKVKFGSQSHKLSWLTLWLTLVCLPVPCFPDVSWNSSTEQLY